MAAASEAPGSATTEEMITDFQTHDRWKSFEDVSSYISKLSKNTVERTLSDIHVPDKDVLIDDLFMVVGQWALKLLCCNQLTFTDDELLCLKRQCRDRMKAHGASVGVDTTVFLNVVLRAKRSECGSNRTTYSFPHWSPQAIMAISYVVGRIIDPDSTLANILEVPPTNFRLREVLLNVVPALSTRSPCSFLQRWGELKEALRHARVTAAYVRDCVLRCRPDHAGKVAELAVLVVNEVWRVEKSEHQSIELKLTGDIHLS
ncbi:uncharacterized protein LOC108674467 [Hyalella azteca]|uniref:Uncharacterized protein LOC108674467 n=1 Tax=Hyalella azteca TaxID=294128 RepID=A0A8B7NVV6_HYAAZ|nr:uncharacterized protein LOC108674467 [Hyalella azteca]